MSSPLSGFTVIDFSHVMAGPFCTHTLHTLGARVIKIERIGEGDVMRHYDVRPEYTSKAPPFIAVNAGKESLALDLKSAQAKKIIRDLVSTADVVVENFRPGVLERLGLGYQECKQWNENIVYCSVSGFGQQGPLKNNPAYDHIVQAMAGVMSLTGEPNSKHLKVGFPVLDTFAGYTAAMAVMSALLQRERFGGGQYIDVAMLDASLNLMISMAAPFLIAGDIPKKVGNRGFNMSPTSDTFRAKDGEISIGANTQKQYEAMCQVMERDDLIHDERFALREGRMKNEAALQEEIEKTTQLKSAYEWESAFNKVGVPSAAIRTIPEISQHEHLYGRGRKIPIQSESQIAKGENSGFTLGPGFVLNQSQLKNMGHAPALGEHSISILRELGYPQSDIDDLCRDNVIQKSYSN